MEERTTSSRPIKLFAKIMFIIGIVFDVIVSVGIIVGGIAMRDQIVTSYNTTALIILTIICAIVFFVIVLLLLLVEKAMLMSYAEIAEDVRDVRNILARRDSKN